MQESIDESPNFTNICIFRCENAYLWRNFNVICSVYTFFHIFSKLLPQSLKFFEGIASMAFGEYTLLFFFVNVLYGKFFVRTNAFLYIAFTI
jgi:hypothetical protein